MSSVQILISLLLVVFMTVTGCNELNQSMSAKQKPEMVKQGQSIDNMPPSITITSPTTEPDYTTDSQTLALSGTVMDDKGVTKMSWRNDKEMGGDILVNERWSLDEIQLNPGLNIITISAQDAAGNTADQVLTITYNAMGEEATKPDAQSGEAAQQSGQNMSEDTLQKSDAQNVAQVNTSSMQEDKPGSNVIVNNTKTQ